MFCCKWLDTGLQQPRETMEAASTGTNLAPDSLPCARQRQARYGTCRVPAALTPPLASLTEAAAVSTAHALHVPPQCYMYRFGGPWHATCVLPWPSSAGGPSGLFRVGGCTWNADRSKHLVNVISTLVAFVRVSSNPRARPRTRKGLAICARLCRLYMPILLFSDRSMEPHACATSADCGSSTCQHLSTESRSKTLHCLVTNLPIIM